MALHYTGRSHGVEMLPYAAGVIGQAIKVQHLTFAQVGGLCDPPLSGTAINAFVAGKNWMKMEHLLHVAQVLGVPPESLWPPDPLALLPHDPRHPLVRIVKLLRGRPLPLLTALVRFLELESPTRPTPTPMHSQV